MNYPNINQVKLQIKIDLGGNPTEQEIIQEYESRRIAWEKELVKYNKLVEYKQDVLNEMLSVFGTTSTEVATANYETYKLMKSAPELFSSEGLKDDNNLDLDTDQKVLDYASAKVSAIEAYGVYRIKRYQQYKDEIAALES